MKAELSRGGLLGSWTRHKARDLVERPATMSSLIHNFRSFAERVAREIPGPLVVAVDELDKMVEAEKLVGLLRHIKGIFDVPDVHFLVSISDEAARSVRLGTVKIRNEFHSSFYSVISIGPFRPEEVSGILKKRGIECDEVVARAIGVLSGGIPREVVRMADAILSGVAEVSIEGAVLGIMRDEAEAFRQEFIGPSTDPAEPSPNGEEKVRVHTVLAEEAFADGRSFIPFARSVFEDGVKAESAGGAGSFGEEWRKLLLRLQLAGLILEDPARHLRDLSSERLQRVVNLTSASPDVGQKALQDAIG
jgi:hypothetical protein